MRTQPPLFAKTTSHDHRSRQIDALKAEARSIPGDQALNVPVHDLVDYLVRKYALDVPQLSVHEIMVEQNEVQIDVREDAGRNIYDRSRPHYVNATELSFDLPFTGDPDGFSIRPSTYSFSPPRAEIRDSYLVLRVVGTSLAADHVRRAIDERVEEIERWLEVLRRDSDETTRQLRDAASTHVQERKDKVLRDRNLVGSLGFNLKARGSDQRTFVAPNIRRKLAPDRPRVVTTAPFQPEPTLDTSDYEHILSVLQNMVHVMERSPSAFSAMSEESIRSHFLVQLNGHFEGQALGETFNYGGKTDILVRSEGRNIFIAECKFWSGPKGLMGTIDQVLGYTAWRDTKVAVLVFNRNKQFSLVLRAIPPAVSAHPNFKRTLPESSETVFRYVFKHNDDINRELFLTVLAFDVPASQVAEPNSAS